MNASFWTPYISDGTIQAICWTLIHSLWIGLVIALLAGLVIALTRKSAANLRYVLLCGILIMFVLSVSVVFYLQVRSNSATPSAANTTGFAVINHDDFVKTTNRHLETPSQSKLVNEAIKLLNQNINSIFLVWLLFFMLKSLRLVSGLLYIRRIRNYKVHQVAEEFKHKLSVFSSQIGIRRAVRLVQSELVRVPVAVGWLKPMILLPMGVILQLPAEQLEAILWHELAHIRRRDYLVNILQGLVETVFFFNPGLLWLSSLIRAEREACCDDMVLGRMNRKANYLEALLAFGYQEFKQPGLVMSIGTGDQLRNRLKRMISQENKRLSIAEKAVLTTGLVLLSAFTTIHKISEAAPHRTHTPNKRTAVIIAKRIAGLPAQPPVFNKSWRVGQDTNLVNRDTAIRFTSVLFKQNDEDLANNDIRAMDDRGNEYHFVVTDNQLTAMEINKVKVTEDKLAGFQYMIRSIARVLDTKRRVRAEDIAGFKANSPRAKFKDTTNDSKKKYSIDARKAGVVPTEQFEKGNLDAGSEPQPKFYKSEAGLKRKQQDDANYATQRQRVNDIIADLIREKVVAATTDVKWFGLSDTELIVNGQKQSAALQQKLQAKYGVHKNYGLYYGSVKMTGTGVFIDDDETKRNKPQQPGAKQNGFWSPKQELLMQQDMQRKFYAQRPDWRPRIAMKPIVSNIIADLILENVIHDETNVSFNLTNSSLIVNGIKQPDKIHERLKTKYLSEPKYPIDEKIMRDPDFGLHYDAEAQAMGIGITSGYKDSYIK